jgi:hypothetical protein
LGFDGTLFDTKTGRSGTDVRGMKSSHIFDSESKKYVVAWFGTNQYLTAIKSESVSGRDRYQARLAVIQNAVSLFLFLSFMCFFYDAKTDRLTSFIIVLCSLVTVVGPIGNMQGIKAFRLLNSTRTPKVNAEWLAPLLRT